LPSISCLLLGSTGCSFVCGASNKIATGKCVQTTWARWKECQCVERDNVQQNFALRLNKIRIDLLILLSKSGKYRPLSDWIRVVFSQNNLDQRNRIKIDKTTLYALLGALDTLVKFDVDFYKNLFSGLAWDKNVPEEKIHAAANKVVANFNRDNRDANLKLLHEVLIDLFGGSPLSYNPTYIETLLGNLLPNLENSQVEDSAKSTTPETNLATLNSNTQEKTRSLFDLGYPKNYFHTKEISPLRNTPKNFVKLIKLVFSDIWPKGSPDNRIPLNRDNTKILLNILTSQPDFSIPDTQLDIIIENVKTKLKLSDSLPLNEDSINNVLRIISNHKVNSLNELDKSMDTIVTELKSNKNNRSLTSRSTRDWKYTPSVSDNKVEEETSKSTIPSIRKNNNRLTLINPAKERRNTLRLIPGNKNIDDSENINPEHDAKERRIKLRVTPGNENIDDNETTNPEHDSKGRRIKLRVTPGNENIDENETTNPEHGSKGRRIKLRVTPGNENIDDNETTNPEHDAKERRIKLRVTPDNENIDDSENTNPEHDAKERRNKLRVIPGNGNIDDNETTNPEHDSKGRIIKLRVTPGNENSNPEHGSKGRRIKLRVTPGNENIDDNETTNPEHDAKERRIRLRVTPDNENIDDSENTNPEHDAKERRNKLRVTPGNENIDDSENTNPEHDSKGRRIKLRVTPGNEKENKDGESESKTSEKTSSSHSSIKGTQVHKEPPDDKTKKKDLDQSSLNKMNIDPSLLRPMKTKDGSTAYYIEMDDDEEDDDDEDDEEEEEEEEEQQQQVVHTKKTIQTKKKV
ncbi:glutamic acid-rich protein-like, partial [Diaphorina citri]|uniref:Glutamic acid-rich protein-like n=1 Tax=Diaphorina citri TaxID=121845 RepID=A0A1S4EF29_DIACI